MLKYSDDDDLNSEVTPPAIHGYCKNFDDLLSRKQEKTEALLDDSKKGVKTYSRQQQSCQT